MQLNYSTLINSNRVINNSKAKQKYMGATLPLGYDTVHFGANTDPNRIISEEEANRRLTNLNRPEYDVDPVVVRKACMNKGKNIKENLVQVAEKLQQNNFSDKKTAQFIKAFKNDNGVIDESVMRYLSKASKALNDNDKQGNSVADFYKKSSSSSLNKKDSISQDAISTILACSVKVGGSKVITEDGYNSTISDVKEYNIPPSKLSMVYASYQNIPIVDPDVPPMFARFVPPTYVNKPEHEKPFKEFSKKFFESDNIDKNKVSDVEYFILLSSFINPDASLNKPVMDLSLELANSGIQTGVIPNIVANSVNPEDGALDDEKVSFIRDIISDSPKEKVKTPAYSTILNDFVGFISSPKYNIQDYDAIIGVPEEYFDHAKTLYKTLPKNENEEKNPELFINKVAVFVSSSVSPKDNHIDPDAVEKIEKLNDQKYNPKSIMTIMDLSRTVTGDFDNKKFNDIVSHKDNLPPEEKQDIKSVDLELVEDVLQQTITYKSGKVSIEDFESSGSFGTLGQYENNKRVIESPSKEKTTYTKIYDAKRGVKSKSIAKDRRTVSDITVFKDLETGKTKKIEYVSSSQIPGILDLRERDIDGNVKVLSTGYLDKDGNKIVKRDFKSFDDTRTQYDYKESPKGSNASDYTITDKDGNVLLYEHKTFDVIDDNHFKSSINGHNYDMNVDKDHFLTVTDDKQKTVSFDFDELTGDNYPVFKDVLKHIPGNEFFNMKKAGTKGILPLDYDNACYAPSNYIFMGKSYTKPSTYFHEFGHNKDVTVGPMGFYGPSPMYKDYNFLKTSRREMNLYTKNFPSTQRNYIDYFVSHLGQASQIGAKRETIAETNSILNTPYQDIKDLEFRTIYLQRYFPKTIAHLAKSLNPDIYNSDGI